MNVLKEVRKALGGVVGLVVPERCWAREEGCEGGVGLSEGALEGIGKLAGVNYCFHCGLGIGPYERHDARDPCGRCGEREVGVVRMARVGAFEEPLVRLVHRMKFGRAWEVARVVGPFLYGAMVRASEATGVGVGAVVPVPLHFWRRSMRGFNQAEELAREVGRLGTWELVHGLKRVKRTEEQARIGGKTRRAANMKGAFGVAKVASRGALAGKHVWLVDDVSTTGATLHAAATALRKLPVGMRPASINAAVLCVVDKALG